MVLKQETKSECAATVDHKPLSSLKRILPALILDVSVVVISGVSQPSKTE